MDCWLHRIAAFVAALAQGFLQTHITSHGRVRGDFAGCMMYLFLSSAMRGVPALRLLGLITRNALKGSRLLAADCLQPALHLFDGAKVRRSRHRLADENLQKMAKTLQNRLFGIVYFLQVAH